MKVDMTPGRFCTLARTYGGELRRWPEVERAAARAFLAAGGESARRVLQAEAELDARLDLSITPAPDHALLRRVLDGAPPARSRRRPWRSAPAWLAPGAGLAAACCAGAWLGVAVSQHAETQLAADSVLVASADLAAADPDATGVR